MTKNLISQNDRSVSFIEDPIAKKISWNRIKPNEFANIKYKFHILKPDIYRFQTKVSIIMVLLFIFPFLFFFI